MRPKRPTTDGMVGFNVARSRLPNLSNNMIFLSLTICCEMLERAILKAHRVCLKHTERASL